MYIIYSSPLGVISYFSVLRETFQVDICCILYFQVLSNLAGVCPIICQFYNYAGIYFFLCLQQWNYLKFLQSFCGINLPLILQNPCHYSGTYTCTINSFMFVGINVCIFKTKPFLRGLIVAVSSGRVAYLGTWIMFAEYLFLRFCEIRQINPLQTLMNLQYMYAGVHHIMYIVPVFCRNYWRWL